MKYITSASVQYIMDPLEIAALISIGEYLSDINTGTQIFAHSLALPLLIVIISVSLVV